MTKKILFFSIIVIAVFFVWSSKAHAAYLASDVLGQLDANGLPTFTTNNTGTSSTAINTPGNVVLDTVHHRLFVSEITNKRVLVFNLDADNNLIDHTADYVLGQSDFTHSNTTTPTQSGLSSAVIAYDSDRDKLYVGDSYNYRVMVFDTVTITDGEPAINILGQANFTSQVATTTQSSFDLRYPYYSSASSTLFVPDGTAHRIMVFDVSSVEDNENAINVLGQINFTDKSAALTQSGMNLSWGPYHDASRGLLYVPDLLYSRVMIYDIATIVNGENAVHVLGQGDFTTSSPATSINGLRNPSACALDADNNRLFVSDGSNSRIVVFDVDQINDGENAVAILGQDDFTQSNTGVTQSALYFPVGLTYDDANRRLYVADQSNKRILIYNFVNLSSAAFSAASLARSYSQTATSTNWQGTVTYSLYSGSLPPGLSLASDGTLSGTPTTLGTYNFSIQATDTLVNIGNFVDKRSYSITVGTSGFTAPAPPAPPAPSATNPTGGFNVLINPTDNGTSSVSTNNRLVTLKFLVGGDVSDMAISEDFDFKNAVQEPYVPTKQWLFSTGDGTKTIYAKFYTYTGISSPVVAVSTILNTSQAPAIIVPAAVTVVPATDPNTTGTYTPASASESTPSLQIDLNIIQSAVTSTLCIPETLIKSVSNSSVYYCGGDGLRYVFANESVYFTWFKDFLEVKVLTDAELAQIPLGHKLITHRPGVKMVKIQTDPKVYAVARGGVLRWIKDEATAKLLYGDNWNTQILDVSDALFTSYAIGEPIN